MDKQSLPDQLLQFRQQIDAIDAQLLKVLAQRFQVTNQVGQLKAQEGLDSVDPVRENQKLEALMAQAREEGLEPAFVRSLFQMLFQEVVKNHQALLAEAQEKASLAKAK